MKVKMVLLSLVFLTIAGLFAASKVKLDETIVSARYEMLACEDCFHMTVEKSKDGRLDGETIIPISSKVDIEQLINSVAITKKLLCLRGKPFWFNLNLFGINPNGVRFEVTEKLSPMVCSEF